VGDKVQEAVTPLANQARESVEALRIHELVARASDADDAKAYDELLQIKDSEPPKERELIQGVIADRQNHEHDLIRPGAASGCIGFSLKNFFDTSLSSPDVATRREILDDCTAWSGNEYGDNFEPDGRRISIFQIEEQVVPKVVRVAVEDASLIVRAQAIDLINHLFKESPGFPQGQFDLFDAAGVKHWWEANKANYQALELISAVSDGARNVDSVDLYDELYRFEVTSSPTLKNAIEEQRARMRTAAAGTQDGFSHLFPTGLSDGCNNSQVGFTLSLRGVSPRGSPIDSNDELFKDVQGLMYCPIVVGDLPRIAEFATKSQRLSRRCAATAVLNKWLNQTFDPFDIRAIEVWWASHKAEYGD
jgi:hypothetical protein